MKRFVLTLLAAFALSACSGSPSDNLDAGVADGGKCDANVQCSHGLHCWGGMCVPDNCDDDGDCPTGYSCEPPGFEDKHCVSADT